MSTMTFSLLATRRLGPLCATQACGALNDNLVKNAMAVLVLFGVGHHGVGFSALAGALFIAPYMLLSATAGQVADRFDRTLVIRAAKVAEVLLMAVAAAGFLTGNLFLLLATLFGLGVQAAAFGPVKYAILPERLAPGELVAGNGIVEATTFLAILAGTVAGGALVGPPHGRAIVATLGCLVSVAGLVAAFAVPLGAPGDRSIRVGWNVFAETARVVREARAGLGVWRAILGLSWFWTVGATILTEFPNLARDTLVEGPSVVTLFLATFAVGIGIGSVACARLLKGEVSPRYVPFTAFAMTVFLADFGFSAARFGHRLHDAGALALVESASGVRMLVDLLLLAVAGGVFSVPLYAMLQEWAPPGRRARTIAANNVVNAVAMIVAAMATAALAACRASPPETIEILAVANLLVAVWIVRLLPRDTFRALFRGYFRVCHRVRVRGMENYLAAGDRVVIVSNHLSFADACLIACYLPDGPAFAIHTRMAATWWAKPFLAAVDTFEVDLQSPYAVKRMVEAIRDDGRKLMIFPEGRLTKTGSLMKIYPGAALVAAKTGARIVPLHIDGLQYTRLSRMRGKLPMRWFPRLALTVHPAVDALPEHHEDLSPRAARAVSGRRLHDAMVEAAFLSRDVDKTLWTAFLDAKDLNGSRTPIVEDVARVPLSYGRVALGAVALGRALARLVDANVPEEARANDGDPLEARTVGLMLPNAVAGLVTFMALQAFDRVPCMLNFSAGAEGMISACRAARLRTVATSRTFVEKAKLEAAVTRLIEAGLRVVFLEDVRASLRPWDKVRAKLDVVRARTLPGARRGPRDWAAVLFTSGSEGVPKGVVHSHRSLLSNCAQAAAVIDFNGSDRVFNALPAFHSFGLTVGTLLPALHGIPAFQYPSPLHYRIVPAMVYDTDATIVFGTDTFLTGWARHADPYDFRSVRYVFAGAEKIRDATRRLFADRFGVRILEGYGATETAPVLSINTAMDNRPGSVGRMLPGMTARLEPVEGVQGSRLHVGGANLMLGYLLPTEPGVLVPCDGEYDTGDVVSLDAEGFVTILDRLKRFAKIAGEMVSMIASENLVGECWPDDRHAIVKVPDARKGEALLLVTTRRGADARELLRIARERGTPEIVVPRSLMEVDAIPLLGTGKVDYPALAKLVEARHPVEDRAGHDEEEDEDAVAE